MDIIAEVFPTGKIVMTKNVWNALSGDTVGLGELATCIIRHRSADFGNVDNEDWNANMRAVRDGERILSSYTIGGLEVWVITNADRSVTTLLLPEDY